MKFEIFSLIVSLVVVTAYTESEEYNKIIGKCVESVGADRNAVKAMWKDGETDDCKSKCVMACTFKAKGSMDADGGVNKEIMKNGVARDLPEERRQAIIEAIDECADIREDDECETAYSVFNCIFEEMLSEEDEKE